jgi:predicted secreted Zn-dependent protease
VFLRVAIAAGFSAWLVGCASSTPKASDLTSLPPITAPSPDLAPLAPIPSPSNTQTLTTANPSPSPPFVQAANSTLQPSVTVDYRYYSVSGSTPQALRSQLNRVSPVFQDGQRFDGKTYWYVRWFYYYANTGNSCRITQVKSSVEVELTLPQWQQPTNAPRSLVNQWQRYMTALQLHEDGHKDHGVAAAQEVLSVINNLPAYPSCPELETAANAAGKGVLQRYNQKDIEYDRVTQHGATQGAIFP